MHVHAFCPGATRRNPSGHFTRARKVALVTAAFEHSMSGQDDDLPELVMQHLGQVETRVQEIVRTQDQILQLLEPVGKGGMPHTC